MKKLILAVSIMIMFILTLSTAYAMESDNSTLQDPVSGGTFEMVQDAVDNSAQSDTVVLEGVYTGSGEPLTIDKPLTLKGQGSASLNAVKQSRILDIKSDDVVIENIAFSSGKSDECGGILIEGSNIRIVNCSFSSNNGEYGGGILSSGDNVSIINCSFTKNQAQYTGGAIELDGDGGLVENCVFKNNYAGHVGGAVAWVGDNGILRNSTFLITIDPDYPSEYGGAVTWIGANGIIDKSVFDSNTAKYSGAAVYWRGGNGILKNSIFTNNTSGNDSACYGNPLTFKNNYWGANFNNDEEFAEAKLIYYNSTFQSPQSWANLIIEKYDVFFQEHDGGVLDESLPDYAVNANGADIILSANYYKFKRSTSLTASNIVSYNNGKYFKLTLKDADNKNVAGKYVQVTINGKTYDVRTDANGVAKLKLKTLKPKTYSIKIAFKGGL